MIIILLLGVLLTACGIWLMKMVLENKKSKSDDSKMEFTEETAYTLVSMGVVMLISSIVKMAGGIGTGAFVFIFILNFAGLAGLLYLIYQKHYSHN